MIRHIVLFRWKEGVGADHVEATKRGLSEMPAKIPQIKNYRFGSNLGVNPGTFDFGVVADFASLDDYLVYRDHPDHKAFIAAHTADYISERAAIQYEID